MTCLAHLTRPKDNKILKTEKITKDTYQLCEDSIKDRNNRLNRKDESKWRIVAINV